MHARTRPLAEFADASPRLHGPLFLASGTAPDCVTRSALEASLDRNAFAACLRNARLPCAEWHWVSASIRVDPPRDGHLVAMTGHEAVTMEVASCFARAFRTTRWVDHESDAPVMVSVALAWTDQACLY